jgi:hypothetical protein
MTADSDQLTDLARRHQAEYERRLDRRGAREGHAGTRRRRGLVLALAIGVTIAG